MLQTIAALKFARKVKIDDKKIDDKKIHQHDKKSVSFLIGRF